MEHAILEEPQLSLNFFKIVVVGDFGVGKSSLVARFVDNFFREAQATTIGIDYKTRSIVLPGSKTNIKLEIFDTAGAEKFRPIASAYYQNASGIIVVYDVQNLESFENVTRYVDDLKFQIPPDAEIIIAGNKSDCEDGERKVAFQHADAVAQKLGLSLVETSAKSGENVETLFMEMADRLKEKLDIDPTEAEGHSVNPSFENSSRNWCIFCCL